MCVTKQLFYLAEVGSSFKKMRGKTMPKCMYGGGFLHSGFTESFSKNISGSSGSHFIFRAVEEKIMIGVFWLISMPILCKNL
jgi:hypothetical protein